MERRAEEIASLPLDASEHIPDTPLYASNCFIAQQQTMAGCADPTPRLGIRNNRPDAQTEFNRHRHQHRLPERAL
jgi:hypothetical protein